MFGGGAIFADSQGVPMSDAGGADAKKPRQEEKMAVLPVFCSVIAKAVAKSGGEDSEIRFFGTEPGMLLLVGQVESISQNASSLEFTLNDSTGRLKARYYKQGSEETIEVGKYVTIAGQIRTAPELHISVTAMRPVQTADEISYHMIEAAHAALKLQGGRVIEPLTPATPMPKRQPTELSSQVSPPKDAAYAAVAAPLASVPTPASAPAKRGLEGPELQKAIASFVQKRGEGSEEGVAIATICGQFLPASDKNVRSAIEELVDNGELFTTIDDDHFQAI